MRRSFVPERGDVVWLSFSPHRGREQAGRRPALVLSPQRYNDRVGLAVVCPITSRIKGYPFEVEMRDVPRSRAPSWAITSAAFDWRARRAERAGRTPPDVLDEVVAKLRPLIEG